MRSALAELLPLADPPSTLVGIEQEWQLWSADGQLDFRTVLPLLDVAVRGCDPSDRRATRLASGFALTADGWEAELATPPVALTRDAPDRLVRRLAAERGALERTVNERHPATRLEGFSTHINVSVSDELVVAVARDFTWRCGIAASLLMGHSETPGLVVRPRRGRLEVCGDFLEGDDLTAAVVFVSACAAMLLVGEADDVLLPRPQDVDVVAARERYGFYLDRRASGRDLFAELRATPLRGTHRSAQDQLEESWACARPFAVTLGLDPSPVDDRVTGRVPLPGERLGHHPDPPAPAGRPAQLDVSSRCVDSDLTVELAWLTWAHAAWRVRDERGRTCHAVLPVEQQAAFLALLDDGRLTPLLRRALRPRVFSRVVAPVLAEASQASGPGIWKRVDPSALVPRERPLRGGGASGGAGGQDPKRDRSEFEPRAPRFGRKLVPLAAAGAVALVLATVIGAVALGGGDEGDVPGAGDSSPDAAGSPSPVVTTAPPPEATDLSGGYRGTTLRKFRPIIGLEQSVSPPRTESVRGRIECDEQVCRIRVELLVKRFQRPIEVPATGGVDRFSRPSSGDPCSDRTLIASREEGWVRLDETGLRWRLERFPDTYSTCAGGVFTGGSIDTGSATRSDR